MPTKNESALEQHITSTTVRSTLCRTTKAQLTARKVTRTVVQFPMLPSPSFPIPTILFTTAASERIHFVNCACAATLRGPAGSHFSFNKSIVLPIRNRAFPGLTQDGGALQDFCTLASALVHALRWIHCTILS